MEADFKDYLNGIKAGIAVAESCLKVAAYEFHNHKTGHCYVDYIEREGKGEKEGYTKIELYKCDTSQD